MLHGYDQPVWGKRRYHFDGREGRAHIQDQGQSGVFAERNGNGHDVYDDGTRSDAWLAERGGLLHLEPDPIAEDAAPPEMPVKAAPVIDQELHDIVRELIVELGRKSIVGDVEAKAMMRKLSK